MEAIVLSAFKIIGEISSLSDEAKFNKLRCKDLGLRCRYVESYLKNFNSDQKQSLEGLIETLKDCKKFMIKMNTSGLITKFFRARSINQEYELLKSNLDYWKTQSKEDLLYINTHQEDNKFNSKISDMNRRLERGKKLLNAKNIDNHILDKTIIDESFIQKGNEKNYSFAFGTVHDGLFKKKQKVIIKEINFVFDNTALNMIKKGILLNWNLKDCDYVLKVYGMTKPLDHWMVIVESTTFGVLNNLFKYKIDNKDKLSMTRKIAAGIAYIHECGIIHKDIRSHNIMIDYNFEPKITGFEMSREVSTATYSFEDADAFVQKWWSPEKLAGKGSSKASDVYSFGILMYEISMFSLPPDNKQDILESKYGHISENYSKLMKKCLNYAPLSRPNMIEIVLELFDQENDF